MHVIIRLLSLVVVTGGLHAEALQVFILAGQSNMQGHAQVRTLHHLGMDPATAPLLADLLQPDGSPRVSERTWISCLGCPDQERSGRLTTGFGATPEKLGPELTFGVTMQRFTSGRILLIKTAWGGKSLHTDFRPPGAGPYVFNDSQLAAFAKQGKDIAKITDAKQAETGVYYRLMIAHVRSVLADPARVVPGYDAAQGYHLAGFAWFQGWNDMVDGGTYPQRDQPGGYAAYSDTLAQFIRDVRTDLNAPDLPFAIGVLGVGGPIADYPASQRRYQATHRHFRDAMAAPADLPEFRGTVTAVLTERYWDRELSDARIKEQALHDEAKRAGANGKATAAEERAAFARLRQERLSERERTILDAGVSNQEYHYLGSAKILGGIGVGLAEALAELNHWKRTTP